MQARTVKAITLVSIIIVVSGLPSISCAVDNRPDGLFNIATRQMFNKAVNSLWFYGLDLIGTVAFGIAGFIRAKQHHYDLGGAFVLTSLPAVGGGTLRDLLVGGDRHPPFVFNDPVYIYIIITIVVIGAFITSHTPATDRTRFVFDRALLISDTIGLAAFTVIGAKVAIVAGLHWFWIPICAGLTCAGGGILLDICTGREPRTFQGEFYEELAIIGGMMLMALLYLANYVPITNYLIEPSHYIVFVVLITLVFVFCLRLIIVRKNVHAPCLN